MSRRTPLHPSRIVILACVAAAGLLMMLVAHDGGRLRPFDEGVLLALRDRADRADPVGPLWLEIFFRDVTALGSHAVLALLVLAAAVYLRLLRQHASVLLLALSVLGGMALSTGLKLVFDRPRPDLVAHLADIHTASFPSGHAMLSAVAYLTLAGLIARVQPRPALKRFVLGVGVALAALVGISRVYLGVHWPSDVLAGWCLGAAWALICRVVVERWDRPRGRCVPEVASGSLHPPG